MIETTQAEARAMARRLSEETGVVHVADTIRPSTKDGQWLRGGWADKTSVWVVIDQSDNSIAWPKLEADAQ